jgi:shikimate dehydrogenase
MTVRRYLTGLIGRGIGASRSPYMHESEADAQGIRLVYKLFDFAEMGCDESDLPRILDAARLLGFAGVNVTHPYKQTVIAHLDELSDGARRIGAVNTVAMSNGKLVGHNTDMFGFAESFRRGLADASVGRVVQIGAGGAGAATAHALMDLGIGHLTVHDIDAGRAQALMENLAEHYDPGRLSLGDDLAATVSEADGVLNATPMGMAEHPGLPLPADLLRKDLWVADIVYFPLETALLRAAQEAGCRTLDGAGMAVYQAVKAFDIFTGLKTDAGRMHEAFLSYGS